MVSVLQHSGMCLTELFWDSEVWTISQAFALRGSDCLRFRGLWARLQDLDLSSCWLEVDGVPVGSGAQR